MCLQLPALRPQDLSNKRLAHRHKSVNRAYGGHLAHHVVRERCAAFLCCAPRLATCHCSRMALTMLLGSDGTKWSWKGMLRWSRLDDASLQLLALCSFLPCSK